jgi:hypothetical protein
MTHKILGLLVGGFLLALASPALGASVTVQIEGAGQALAPTVVSTPASVTKDGNAAHSCNGTTALGALDAAVAGDWSGPWADFGGGTYSPYVIRGENHPFDAAFWAVWVNNAFQNTGFCQITLHDGDKVLVYAADNEFQPGAGGYDYPVFLTVPPAIEPGVPFTAGVVVSSVTFNSDYSVGTTHLMPATGAKVTAGGATATTGADGTASLTVPDAGPVTLVATLGNHAPDRTTRCATNGSDGACGTTVKAPCVTSGDDGRCGSPDKHAAYGFVTSVKDGQKFAAGKGPRELGGRVDDEPSGIADVRLRLARSGAGSCGAYDAKREAFVAARCGAAHARWFSAGTQAGWRYLLPGKLTTGRYVLDVLVVDKAGNKDAALARGRNRVVFTVA